MSLFAPLSSAFAEPGLQFDLRVTLGLEDVVRKGTTDEGDQGDDGLSALSNLEFGLSSDTRSQSFNVSGSTDLRYNLDNADGLDTDNDTLRLNYETFSRNVRLSFNSFYRNTDIDDTILEQADIDDSFLIIDRGRVETIRFNTALRLGAEGGPLTTLFTYSLTNTEFSDNDQTDRQVTEASVVTDMRVSTLLRLSAGLSRFELEEDGPDGTQRETTTVSLTSFFTIDRVTEGSAALSFRDIDTNDASASGDGGLGLRLGLAYTRPNGVISADYSATQTVEGIRQQLFLGRNVITPRGSASIRIGASKTEGFDLEPLINATLNYALRMGSQLSATISQQVITDTNNEETVQSRASVRYQQAVTPRGQIEGQLSFIDRNVLGGDGEDERSAQISLSYNYDLDRNWDLVSRLRYERTDNEISEDTERQSIFVGLERRFSFRP